MNKAVIFFATILLTTVLLASCGSQPQPGSDNQPSSAVPLNEDFHYRQMEELANNQRLELTVTSLFGGQDKVGAYLDSQGHAVYQGDMLLTDTSELQSQAAIVTTRKWPGNTVPYTIASNMSQQQRSNIQTAISFYNTRTNTRWVARTNQRDYVRFINTGNGGCYSYVGRIGGAQEIGFPTWCGVNGAMHEMGHAIGFHHEQSRTDRNSWIRINCTIINCADSNWAIQRESIAFRQYDYYSIMHYGAFSGGRQVIFPLQAGVDPNRIGRSSQLTTKDITAVNFLYPR